MNDYKELIGDLRLGVDTLSKKGVLLFSGEDMTRIADAIEQLVKERDAALSDLKEAMPCRACKYLAVLEHCKNCYSENHWEWRGVKEADDLRINCDCECCKWLIDGDCTDLMHDECHGEHWEWRGVKEEVSE